MTPEPADVQNFRETSGLPHPGGVARRGTRDSVPSVGLSLTRLALPGTGLVTTPRIIYIVGAARESFERSANTSGVAVTQRR